MSDTILDRPRWYRVHRAASRRYSRDLPRMDFKAAWQRYERVMMIATINLSRKEPTT